MEDLISRQAAIDVIDAVFPVDPMKSEYAQGIACGAALAKTYVEQLPSAQPKTDDENELKFYYVESIDDYWIGQRLDNFYYADWHEGLGFVWSKSRYLPWGEHVVNEQTLWKEHTYPSEPKEIPFTMWIVGFLEKYSTDRQSGEWIDMGDFEQCSVCKGTHLKEFETCYGKALWVKSIYCPNCGAKMLKGGNDAAD